MEKKQVRVYDSKYFKGIIEEKMLEDFKTGPTYDPKKEYKVEPTTKNMYAVYEVQ